MSFCFHFNLHIVLRFDNSATNPFAMLIWLSDVAPSFSCDINRKQLLDFPFIEIGKGPVGSPICANFALNVFAFLSASSFFNENAAGTGFAPEWTKNKDIFILEGL